ncbi:MAG TPA: hypothetical protein VD863_04950 [Bradyrhizobium sp.]|jgi:hypothetical protein|nr:hypothetical protein [Bradyrhizobium sp.]
MLWHNSFAGKGTGLTPETLQLGRAQAWFSWAFSPKIALPPPKLNAELTSTRHCEYQALGRAVTYRSDDELDDEVDDTPVKESGRGPLFHIIMAVMLACFGSGSALVVRASGMGLPTLPSFASGASVASSPAPVAVKPIALSDLQALQQQVAGSVQSTERLLAAQQAQQAEIKKLSDQIAALSGKLELLQRPIASAQAALPAPAPAPKPVAAAKPKKPAPVQSSGAISTGGAPLPPPAR